MRSFYPFIEVVTFLRLWQDVFHCDEERGGLKSSVANVGEAVFPYK